MSAEQVFTVAESAALRAHGKPWLLADLHVPLDELLPSDNRYEDLVIRRLTSEELSYAVAIVGASGAGKSSLVAWVSARLPTTHVAIRIPVSALADPTDTGEVLKLCLGTVLDVIALDAGDREEIHIERAEARTVARAPIGIAGGKIGGGAIPVEVNIEVGSLRQEFVENKLDGEYLTGVLRVVAILVSQGSTPIFVFEDTEAIVGGSDFEARVEGFFAGPLRAFVREIDAPCLVAIQDHIAADYSSYRELSASMEVIEIPRMGSEARDALARILSRRLEVSEIRAELKEVFGDDALDGLVQFYDETGGDIRKTLAAAQAAAEEAAAMGAELVRASHVRIGAANWR